MLATVPDSALAFQLLGFQVTLLVDSIWPTPSGRVNYPIESVPYRRPTCSSGYPSITAIAFLALGGGFVFAFQIR
jgi:hypothetical protein